MLFGAIAQRTHFCTMGAISDIVNVGDWTRMRMWVMAMGVAMIGFNVMVAAGWLDAGKSLYGSPRFIWLSALAGGALFGFGMVLASGCGSTTLVRIGAGNLKSLVVFVVLGVSAFATLKGITAVARVASVDTVAIGFGSGQDLPSLLAAATGIAKKSFRWEGFRDAGDTANHLAGALLMGVGGVTALGRTVGQGLSGLSTLSLTSFVAVAAIIAGAVAALHYQVWRIDRAA